MPCAKTKKAEEEDSYEPVNPVLISGKHADENDHSGDTTTDGSDKSSGHEQQNETATPLNSGQNQRKQSINSSYIEKLMEERNDLLNEVSSFRLLKEAIKFI